MVQAKPSPSKTTSPPDQKIFLMVQYYTSQQKYRDGQRSIYTEDRERISERELPAIQCYHRTESQITRFFTYISDNDVLLIHNHDFVFFLDEMFPGTDKNTSYFKKIATHVPVSVRKCPLENLVAVAFYFKANSSFRLRKKKSKGPERGCLDSFFIFPSCPLSVPCFLTMPSPRCCHLHIQPLYSILSIQPREPNGQVSSSFSL